MTYWNMRAYSDGGKMRPRASRAEAGGPTQAQRHRRGWFESGDPTTVRAHVLITLREGR